MQDPSKTNSRTTRIVLLVIALALFVIGYFANRATQKLDALYGGSTQFETPPGKEGLADRLFRRR
ncbi:MAG: hypothetical protein KDD70_11310 [Bdellovibrionales bacterium]|nr:hypothetical protein [Bdellovibrionales bacterium]